VCSSLCKKICCYETQQLILGTGTAISWVTEPHYLLNNYKWTTVPQRVETEESINSISIFLNFFATKFDFGNYIVNNSLLLDTIEFK
jgi:hypothetical protein